MCYSAQIWASPASDAEREIKSLIDRFAGEQETRFQQELFKQCARLVEAKRKLASRPTKAATESRCIAGEKIEWLMGKLADISRRARCGSTPRTSHRPKSLTT